ncbi:MAG: zf-HC2 domain-containing protein [Candidatus Sumerlaeaceae bacterium]|nr:zf-HC2 domain-containing protein [Candidatus Sumerlaeaceae bacterium]
MTGQEQPSRNADAGQGGAHARFRDLIERHVEADLSPAETAELFAHLAHCEPCREVLEAEKRLNERLRRLPRMVAPSDLRAQILREALRDRERSMSALDAGDRLAGLFGREVEPSESDEEPRVFQREMPRANRRRRLSRVAQWQAAAATVFLAAAAISALLTGDFRENALLGRVQQTLREATGLVLALATGTGLNQAESRAPIGGTIIASPAETDHAQSAASAQGPKLVNLQMARIEETGTGLSRLINKQLGLVNEAVSRLADAADNASLPGPAEAERPAIAAIVLRSQPGADARTYDTDEMTEILTAANRDPSGRQRVEPRDQFVFNGRRYRCYTVLVTPEWLQHVTRALDIYRAPAEVPVLRALADQGHRLPRTEQIAFYTAPVSAVRAAAGAMPSVGGQDRHGSPRPLQVIVVDE